MLSQNEHYDQIQQEEMERLGLNTPNWKAIICTVAMLVTFSLLVVVLSKI